MLAPRSPRQAAKTQLWQTLTSKVDVDLLPLSKIAHLKNRAATGEWIRRLSNAHSSPASSGWEPLSSMCLSMNSRGLMGAQISASSESSPSADSTISSICSRSRLARAARASSSSVSSSVIALQLRSRPRALSSIERAPAGLCHRSLPRPSGRRRKGSGHHLVRDIGPSVSGAPGVRAAGEDAEIAETRLGPEESLLPPVTAVDVLP